jgi:hypothetical protein
MKIFMNKMENMIVWERRTELGDKKTKNAGGMLWGWKGTVERLKDHEKMLLTRVVDYCRFPSGI